jgi:hypothetical protein
MHFHGRPVFHQAWIATGESNARVLQSNQSSSVKLC